MKIYRESENGKDFKRVLISANATMEDWYSLVRRAMGKATKRSYGFELPNFFPHSAFSFSVELSSGKRFRFQRV